MAIFEILKEVAKEHLMYQDGLWYLLALIPIILAYFIRPRPKNQTIPALMFLMKESTKSDKKSFLRRLIRDPLLFFQILIIIAFAIAIAKPFMTVAEDVFAEKIAIVIDVSASSQASIDGTTRFDRAIELAKENLGSNNAIILMSAVPELVIDNAESTKARDELSYIKPRDTPTNVFDSMIFAANYVKEKDKIIFISDFIETGTQKDFMAAKNIIESKGILVNMINLRDTESRKARNVGIIDVDIAEQDTSVQIKNFNEINETVLLNLEGADLTIKELTIGPRSVEVVTFPTPAALSKFSIKTVQGHDDFALDNELYLSAPATAVSPLLTISNSLSKHLSTALGLIETVNVERGIPPKVPDINHRIIIISNINEDLLLPGTMKSIKKRVSEGAALIIVAQPDLTGIDFQGLLPVKRADMGRPVLIAEEQFVMPTYENSITEDINFGRVKKYLDVVPIAGSTVLATTANNVSMLVLKNYEKGMVLYSGFMDDHSDFKQDIYYPVFWKRIFEVALKKQEVSELNFKTGKLLNLLAVQKIRTPSGTIESDTIILSKQGIYRTDEKNFVANLLNEEESDINGDTSEEKRGIFDEGSTKKEILPFDLTHYFVIGLLVLVFLELLWIKFRGDL